MKKTCRDGGKGGIKSSKKAANLLHRGKKKGKRGGNSPHHNKTSKRRGKSHSADGARERPVFPDKKKRRGRVNAWLGVQKKGGHGRAHGRSSAEKKKKKNNNPVRPKNRAERKPAQVPEKNASAKSKMSGRKKERERESYPAKLCEGGKLSYEGELF